MRRAALLAASRRSCSLAGAWAAAPAPPDASAWPVTLVDVAARAGLVAPSVYGGVERKRFIIETNGAGVALLDYDNDGWLDALVLERHAPATRARGGRGLARRPGPHQPPLPQPAATARFADVTDARGPAAHGLGVVGLRGRLRQRRRGSTCSSPTTARTSSTATAAGASRT